MKTCEIMKIMQMIQLWSEVVETYAVEPTTQQVTFTSKSMGKLNWFY